MSTPARSARSKTGGSAEYGMDDLDRTLSEMKLVSQIAHDFVTHPLDPDLNSVPGIGAKSIKLLKKEGIVCTDQLAGQFFWLLRDEVKFVQFLEEVGISNKNARSCAKQFAMKFNAI